MATQTGDRNGEYESTASYIWESDTLIERRFYNKNDSESFTSSRIVYDSDGEPQALIVTSGKNGIFNDEVGEEQKYVRDKLIECGFISSDGKHLIKNPNSYMVLEWKIQRRYSSTYDVLQYYYDF